MGDRIPVEPTVELFALHYKGGAEFNKMIESLRAQTYPGCKIIISDNGSGPNFSENLKRFENEGLEVRYRSTGTGDCYSHYNVCISETRSTYVMFCHGDDLYYPDIVTEQVHFMESRPQIDAVLTAANAIGMDDQYLWSLRLPHGLKAPVLDRNEVLSALMTGGNSFFVAPSALFRTSTFKKVGDVRADLALAGDLELWLRILFRGGGLGYLNRPLMGYRMSLTQGSSIYERDRVGTSQFFQVIDEYIDATQFHESGALRSYGNLRLLDQFQSELNKLAKGDKRNSLVHILGDPSFKTYGFGGSDKLRVLGAKVFAPILGSLYGPWLARLLINSTDLRTSPLLRIVIRLSRKYRELRLGG